MTLEKSRFEGYARFQCEGAVPKSDGTFKEVQTVTPAGEPVAALPAGVTFRDTPMHIDSRGSLRELYDLRCNWHAEPLVYAYCFTIRPGFIKGWGLHKLHEDRYFVLCGEMQVVLYDGRARLETSGIALADRPSIAVLPFDI
jgi:dTDP-4-dehydrorhamnose 3,5-epimerase